MKRVLGSFILSSVSFLAMAQGQTADEIKQNLPTGEISIQAKSAGIFGYEITATYVNRSKHTVYMPQLGAGTSTINAFVKSGKTYRQIPVHTRLMQIGSKDDRLTDFKSIAPGAKESFTIYLNGNDIEGQVSPAKFSLSWSTKLILPNRSQVVLRLSSNTVAVQG